MTVGMDPRSSWSHYFLLHENGGLCPLGAVRACSYCHLLSRGCSFHEGFPLGCPSALDLHMKLSITGTWRGMDRMDLLSFATLTF